MIMFKGKVVLVTGASAGLGREIALTFGRYGAIVGLMARRKERLSQLAAEIDNLGGTGIILKADLTSRAEVDEAFDTFVKEFGQMDVLINNAGMGIFGRKPSTDEYMKMYQVNVHAVYQLSLKAFPYLEKTKGVIINIGSSVVERPFAGELVYAATKGAVTAMTTSMAATFGKAGVRVNLIQPGVIDSEFNFAAGLPLEMVERVHQASIGLNALVKTGNPADVAKAACFLASEQAAFITGATLKVDGGLSLGVIKP
jgi:NAD(P)-dependent dehydrogenase (short-subunit alcohol dehydrogenase family)